MQIITRQSSIVKNTSEFFFLHIISSADVSKSSHTPFSLIMAFFESVRPPHHDALANVSSDCFF